MKREYLAEIFLLREFDSEETLDLLCQSWKEPEFDIFILEIQAKSIAASLAVKRALRAREAALASNAMDVDHTA